MRRDDARMIYPQYWRLYLATAPFLGVAILGVAAFGFASETASPLGLMGAFTPILLVVQQVVIFWFMTGWRYAIDEYEIRLYNASNSSRRIPWEEVSTATVTQAFALPVLTITAKGWQRLQVPLFVYKSGAFLDALSEFAGPDHPATVAVAGTVGDQDDD